LQGHTYAEWNRGGDIVCSTGFAVLRAGQEVKPSFLRHLAFSDIVGEQLRERITGSNYPAVRSSDVEELEIPLPPLPEQRRIADVLDTVDAAIQETDAVIDKQEQVKTGLLQDLLTRGLDAEGRLRDPERNPEAFRETELGRLPKQWSVRRFEDLIDEGPQNGLYKPKSAYTDGEQGFPIVRIDSFYGGKLTAKDELRRLKLTESERRKYGLEPDDILVNRVNSTGFIGKNAIVPPLDEPTVFESNIMRIEVDESEILPKYLNGLMNTPIVLHQLQRRAKDAVAQSSINQQDVKGCLIPVPKLEEQGLVVDRIETEEGVIDKERAYKAKLQRLKTGLMQDLLTGRVRVPEAEARVDEVLA
jgi:type I restriction enzyme S subunit